MDIPEISISVACQRGHVNVLKWLVTAKFLRARTIFFRLLNPLLECHCVEQDHGQALLLTVLLISVKVKGFALKIRWGKHSKSFSKKQDGKLKLWETT